MASPRLLGIREHLERAQFLFHLCVEIKEPKASYRLMLAAVYSCRAITELMLEAAEKQEVKNLSEPNAYTTRDALESQIALKLPYYELIERIRIHDFHRFGLIPPDPNYMQIMLGGPIKLMTQKGASVIKVSDKGLIVSTSGSSQVKLKRPLLIQDGEFFDDDSSGYVKLEVILKSFLSKAIDVVNEFEMFVD